MSTLFISHSSRDREQAEELNALLDERGYGWKFLDFDPELGIQAGASWERTLYTKLRACRAVVAICTDNYLDSKWCFAEVALARMEGKKIFALQLEPWGETTRMPSILTADQYIDLRRNREEGLERLWLAFEAAGIIPEQHRKWKPDDPPYPGLRAFDESDEAIFFGREKEVAEGVELLSRVRRQGHPRLAMVLGASGSGKSSLARAGILPRLRREPASWRIVGPFRPGRDPATELGAALSAAFEAAGRAVDREEICRSFEPGPGSSDASARPADGRASTQSRLLEALRSMEEELGGADATVAESLRQLQDVLLQAQEAPAAGAEAEPPPGPERPRPSAGANPLVDWADRLRLARGPSEASIVLVIDQFEELLGHDEEGAAHPSNRFLRLLRDALDAEDSPLLGLATMRSDYLGSFQRCEALIGAVDATFSPDGTLLASSSYDGKVRIWDAASGRLMRTLEGHESDVNGIAFSPDGAILASTSDDQQVRLWVVATGALLRPPLKWHADAVNSVSFSPDGSTLASASEDLTIGLWRLDSAESTAPSRVLRDGHTDEIRSVAFSPDGTALASAGDDGRVVLWDAATGGGRLLWSHGRNDARQVAFSADGSLLASAGRDGTVRLWDRSRPLPPGRLEHDDGLEGVTFSPDGSLLASAQSDGRVLVWRVESVDSPRLAATLEGHADKTYGVEFSPDGSTLASASRDRTVGLWGVGDLAAAPGAAAPPVTTYPRPLAAVLQGHSSGVAKVAFSPVDANLLASASHDKTIRLWDVGRHRPIGEPLRWHSDSVADVAFSPDGTTLASAGNDRMALLWDVESRQPRSAPLEHGHAVEGVAFSWPDGRMLASASRDHTVRLWDVESGRAIGEPLEGHGDEGVTSVAFQPGGGLLASGSNQACCANQILRDDDRTLRLWDVAKRAPSGGALLGEAVDTSHTEGVTRVVFSPVDPDLLVTSGMDHKVLLWDVGTRGSRLLAAHSPGVYDVAISPDGSVLATAGYDGTIRLWDFASGRSLGAPLSGHEGVVEGLAFSRNGLLASAGYDGVIRLWSVDDAGWPETACRVANRNFSLDEWEQLAGEGVAYRCTCVGLPAGAGAPSDAPGCAAR